MCLMHDAEHCTCHTTKKLAVFVEPQLSEYTKVTKIRVQMVNAVCPDTNLQTADVHTQLGPAA